MVYLATFVLTFIVVLIALTYFVARGTPVYRVERGNVIRLLESIIDGRAVDNDWQVFIAYPIRHDEALAEIQKQCMEIAETEYIGKDRRLFTDKGLAQLERLLVQLKAESISAQSRE